MTIAAIIPPGALVFDVGAHAGTKTQQFLDWGAGRVVAFEPQPWRAAELRKRFCEPTCQRYGDVLVEELALGSAPGSLPMLICEKADAISTLEPKWKTGRFKNEADWNKTIEVQVDTLDRMIAKHGLPAFIKIDVECFEQRVLAGLSQPIACISIEFHVEFAEDARTCVDKMRALGHTEFNMGRFHGDDFVLPRWVSAQQILSRIPIECGGDIYGRIRS